MRRVALPPEMAVRGCCSDVMLYRNSRVACTQENVILVPVSTVSCVDKARRSHIGGSSRLCELNLSFRVQQGRSHSHWALRQLRRLNASLRSPNDSAGMLHSFAVFVLLSVQDSVWYSFSCSSKSGCAQYIL